MCRRILYTKILVLVTGILYALINQMLCSNCWTETLAIEQASPFISLYFKWVDFLNSYNQILVLRYVLPLLFSFALLFLRHSLPFMIVLLVSNTRRDLNAGERTPDSFRLLFPEFICITTQFKTAETTQFEQDGYQTCFDFFCGVNVCSWETG